ncbi:OLC1v1000779C1 [Oldenlandia corymbosa var. corymbosa]|uniref:OLC1v1000779C1 n=1 Tax=Oldenlandia corymbosa var. corymbosa TaxID=529605 RepID=A0AAV1D4K6_OLDCO|nr:OLC1v1000779C1 [Oldenlandia corymbosa var. corymbosa]
MFWAADTDTPILHETYDMWDSMIERVKVIIFEHEGKDLLTGKSDFFNVVHKVLVDRWAKSFTPLHCFAHSLVPKYYSNAWLQGGGSGSMKRVAPHVDDEVSSNRFICLKRMFSESKQFKKVSKEYGMFATGSGPFNAPHVVEAREYEEPISWWANYGSPTPILQSLAFKKLLLQPASSSCCERNWSTYSMIHNVKRNRLTSQTAEDLVFVHANIRLITRKKQGPSKYWDICGDKFDIDGDIAELADLSINDPHIEAMTFDENFEENES